MTAKAWSTVVLLIGTLVLPTGARAAAATTAVPHFDHVVVVVEENRSVGSVIGSPSAPYITSLARANANFTASYAETHPSQPNYLALFSGSTQGVTDDNCPYSFTSPDLGSAAIAAGVGFAGYSEALPSTGYTGCASGDYARKHNPWTDFPAVPASANLPFSAFPSSYSELPGVSFVIPDLQHDMHDGTVAQGDSWLQQNLDGYITWAKTHNSLFVLTFDEDDYTDGNRIPTVLAGAHVVPGDYGETINHYAVLRTICDAEGIPAPGTAATTAPIGDIWSATSDPSFVRDTFARTVTGGWGSADVGGVWSVGGPPSDFSVHPGAGTIRLATPGGTDTATLPAATATDTDLRLTLGDDRVPAGGPVYTYVVGRRVSDGNEYDARVSLSPGGGVNFWLVRVVNGVETSLTDEATVPGLSTGPGNPLSVRMQVVGTAPAVLRARVWPASAAEPGTWNATATDSTTTLQANGSVGLEAYLSRRATNAPITLSVPSITAAPSAVAPPPPGPTTIASDTFARTVTGGWGTADVGGAWSIAWMASNAFVSSGSASLRLTPGQTISSYLPSARSASDELVTSLAVDRLPVGGPTYATVVIRRAGTSEYALQLLFEPAGTVDLWLVGSTNGTETSLTPQARLPGVTLTGGRALSVRVQAVGTAPTTRRARAWTASTEPSSWSAVATDASAALQTDGYTGVEGYLSSRATNAPVTLSVSRWTAVTAS